MVHTVNEDGSTLRAKPVHPSIRTARHLATRGNLSGVLIVSFCSENFCVTTYGATKKQCAALKVFNEQLSCDVEDGMYELDALFEKGVKPEHHHECDPADMAERLAEIVERCAKVADELSDCSGAYIAERIRALAVEASN